MLANKYILSIGAISALDNKNHSQFDSDSLTISTEHHSVHTLHNVPVGEIWLSNEELFEQLSDCKFFDTNRSYTRASLLSLSAVRKLVEADKTLDLLKGKKIAVFNGNTAGGIDRSEKYFCDYREGKATDLNDIIGHDPADSTIQIVKFLERSGANVSYYSTISTACSSSAVAIEEGIRMLDYEDVDYVVCGGVDPISKFTINGFISLGIYSKEICKPFDAERDGLNLGEGAAYLLIGREQNKNLGEILSCESSSDAFHQTATSKEAVGPCLAMNKALRSANIEAREITYINAHGTATPNNDESEATAMKTIFGDNVPPFSSTKCYTGHTLGASGAIEATLCIQFNEGENYNISYPTFSFKNKDSGLGTEPLTTKRNAEKGCVMSNSFGFGGGGSSLIINFGESKKITKPSTQRDSYITFVSDNHENISNIPANLRRRMSRMTKGGVAVALETEVEFDALHVALGLGSISDTEKFLESIYSSNEELPNPTTFIQSTFNTLAGNITQIRQNHAPAVTFINRSLSLYNAIAEATWRINDSAENVLIVAAEEGTELSNHALGELNLKGITTKAYSFIVSAKPVSDKSAKIETGNESDIENLLIGKNADLEELKKNRNISKTIAISEDLEGQMLHDAESLKLALENMENDATIVGSYAGQGKHYLHLWR